ncbi:GNAT family N-acetyltransferase [Limibacter armeniacum]|uniref:GNAT family N-acetyltransferase n=1 Tax=Limibacter armeniacum TaxID=466084 RepID=UPI002FE6964A
MEHLIRAIREEELPRLVEMCRDHAAYEQAEYSEINKVAQLKTAIFSEKPKVFCYVVESNAELAGYFSFTFDFSTWDAQTFLYLDTLYLEPAYRGFRIGEKIMGKLIEIAQEHNCVNIQWQTPEFNEGAIKFYKRIGGVAKNKVRFSYPL